MLLECACLAKVLAALVGGGTVGAVAASDAKQQRRSDSSKRDDHEASGRGDGHSSDADRYRAMMNYYSG